VRVFIDGIGVLGPGLAGWEASRLVLAGESPYAAAPVDLPPPALLPAAERRRAVATVKLALAVGTEALAAAARRATEVATVFTSSGGDGRTIDEILTVLATDEREVSPTRFHNSVHNAPSGYWTIATGAHEPSTSLCAHDASFAAGLIEAAAQAVADAKPVMLVAYDLPYPEPINAVRPVGGPFAVALVLTPRPTPRSLAGIGLELQSAGLPSDTEPHLDVPPLETLRRSNPAARSLPLLTALARRSPATLFVEGVSGMSLRLALAPR
jgi:hypothetical protein